MKIFDIFSKFDKKKENGGKLMVINRNVSDMICFCSTFSTCEMFLFFSGPFQIFSVKKFSILQNNNKNKCVPFIRNSIFVAEFWIFEKKYPSPHTF